MEFILIMIILYFIAAQFIDIKEKIDIIECDEWDGSSYLAIIIDMGNEQALYSIGYGFNSMPKCGKGVARSVNDYPISEPQFRLDIYDAHQIIIPEVGGLWLRQNDNWEADCDSQCWDDDMEGYSYEEPYDTIGNPDHADAFFSYGYYEDDDFDYDYFKSVKVTSWFEDKMFEVDINDINVDLIKDHIETRERSEGWMGRGRNKGRDQSWKKMSKAGKQWARHS